MVPRTARPDRLDADAEAARRGVGRVHAFGYVLGQHEGSIISHGIPPL